MAGEKIGEGPTDALKRYPLQPSEIAELERYTPEVRTRILQRLAAEEGRTYEAPTDGLKPSFKFEKGMSSFMPQTQVTVENPHSVPIWVSVSCTPLVDGRENAKVRLEMIDDESQLVEPGQKVKIPLSLVANLSDGPIRPSEVECGQVRVQLHYQDEAGKLGVTRPHILPFDIQSTHNYRHTGKGVYEEGTGEIHFHPGLPTDIVGFELGKVHGDRYRKNGKMLSTRIKNSPPTEMTVHLSGIMHRVIGLPCRFVGDVTIQLVQD